MKSRMLGCVVVLSLLSISILMFQNTFLNISNSVNDILPVYATSLDGVLNNCLNTTSKEFLPLVSNAKLRMFVVSGIYDDRKKEPQITVSIALSARHSKQIKYQCDLKMDNGSVFTVFAMVMNKYSFYRRNFQDRRLGCRLPAQAVPREFRISHNDEATEWLPVLWPKDVPDQVGQCSTSPIRGERYKDSLVEYIEYHMLQGVSRFMIYDLESDEHPGVDKILRHYEMRGVVDRVLWKVPTCDSIKQLQKRVNDSDLISCEGELKEQVLHNFGQWIAHHECLLQYSQAKFVLLMDLDEYFYTSEGEGVLDFLESERKRRAPQIQDENQIAAFVFMTRYYSTRLHNKSDMEVIGLVTRNVPKEEFPRYPALVSVSGVEKIPGMQPKSVLRPREIMRTTSHVPLHFTRNNISDELVQTNTVMALKVWTNA